MLKLKGITKDYAVGDETVHALKGIDLEFRNPSLLPCSVTRAAAKRRC